MNGENRLITMQTRMHHLKNRGGSFLTASYEVLPEDRSSRSFICPLSPLADCCIFALFDPINYLEEYLKIRSVIAASALAAVMLSSIVQADETPLSPAVVKQEDAVVAAYQGECAVAGKAQGSGIVQYHVKRACRQKLQETEGNRRRYQGTEAGAGRFRRVREVDVRQRRRLLQVSVRRVRSRQASPRCCRSRMPGRLLCSPSSFPTPLVSLGAASVSINKYLATSQQFITRADAP